MQRRQLDPSKILEPELNAKLRTTQFHTPLSGPELLKHFKSCSRGSMFILRAMSSTHKPSCIARLKSCCAGCWDLVTSCAGVWACGRAGVRAGGRASASASASPAGSVSVSVSMSVCLFVCDFIFRFCVFACTCMSCMHGCMYACMNMYAQVGMYAGKYGSTYVRVYI